VTENKKNKNEKMTRSMQGPLL